VIIVAIVFVLMAALGLVCRLKSRTASVLVIGTTPLARQIAAEVMSRRGHRLRLIGIVADCARESPSAFDPLVVGSLDRLDEIVETVRPGRIVIALGDRRGRLPMRVLLNARLRGINVEAGVRFYERLCGKLAIEALTPGDLVASGGFCRNCLDRAIRRTLNLAVSATALIMLAPLLAVIALAIKLDSRGPILFVQDRVGRGGRRFALLKFRTMHSAWRTTSEWAGDNGARITRIGRWLRRSHLDELPQLLNILRGDMSLVGPRPHPVCNYDLFLAKIPYYSLRSIVRPGLTGWAQVKQGYANSLEEEIEKMRYDLYYIKHMSAWLDLRILFDTLRIVFSDHGQAVPARTAAQPAPFQTSAWQAGPRLS